MLFYEKKGVTFVNGKLKRKFDIQVRPTKKGYKLVGYNNNKLFNKNINILKTKKHKQKTKKHK